MFSKIKKKVSYFWNKYGFWGKLGLILIGIGLVYLITKVVRLPFSGVINFFRNTINTIKNKKIKATLIKKEDLSSEIGDPNSSKKEKNYLKNKKKKLEKDIEDTDKLIDKIDSFLKSLQ